MFRVVKFINRVRTPSAGAQCMSAIYRRMMVEGSTGGGDIKNLKNPLADTAVVWQNTDGQAADGQIIHIKKNQTPKQTYCTGTKYITEHQFPLS